MFPPIPTIPDRFQLTKTFNGKWQLLIPAGEEDYVWSTCCFYVGYKFQNFYSFARAVEYMNYLTKTRDYDWKTIHK